MNDVEEISKAMKINEDIQTITNPILLYALQRSIEEKIKKLGDR